LERGEIAYQSFLARYDIQRRRLSRQCCKRAKRALVNDQKVAEPRVVPATEDDVTVLIANTALSVAKNPFRPYVEHAGK
jgi:hypothetical protein